MTSLIEILEKDEHLCNVLNLSIGYKWLSNKKYREEMRETMGFGGTIIFGKTGVEPIPGVTALESVEIEVDPQNQRLKRMPATRLKPIKRKV